MAEAVTGEPRDDHEAEELDGRIVEPADPAGTRPKVDKDALLPARRALGSGSGSGSGSGAPPPPVDDEPPHAAPLPEPVAAGGVVAEPGERREAPHAARFQFLLGALLAVGVVAILGLILVVGSVESDDPGNGWSAWRPSGNGIEGAQQIADHVAPQYKTSKGQQLTHVEASELEVGDIELELVQRQPAAQGGEILRLDGDVVGYRLCGLGRACAIPGKPSASRSLLLRREAVEIASYTFRYQRGLEYVAFFMPPVVHQLKTEGKKGTTPVPEENQLLLFRRGDLEPILDAPLSRTLKSPPPTVKTMKKAPDVPIIEALTAPAQFSYTFSQGTSDDHAYLVLEKLTPQELMQRAAEATAAGGAATGATATPPAAPAGG